MGTNLELEAHIAGQPDRFQAAVKARWEKAGADKRSDVLPRNASDRAQLMDQAAARLSRRPTR